MYKCIPELSAYSGTNPPAMPHDGAMWYDTDDAETYIYVGTEWVPVQPEVDGLVRRIMTASKDAFMP